MPSDGIPPLEIETGIPRSPIVLAPSAVIAIRDRAEPTELRQRRWAVAALIVAGVIVVLGYWWAHRPVEVSVTKPVLTPVMETIASSGLVGGVKESVIGASFNGAVLSLAVKLGDHVESGQTLAVLKNDIAKAQVVQAESGVLTALAQLRQVSRGPLPSELQAARMQVSQARASAGQAASELTLARATLERTQTLARDGILSRSELDAANASFSSGEAKVRAATAAIRLSEAQLQTLSATPRKEDVELARDRLAEARQAVLVVRRQAAEATVTAPFSGSITAVNAELGQNVDNLGLFALVSDELEIRVDLDESNLADISVGQKAHLVAAAFPANPFEAELKEISPAVNKIRGTVSIKLRPVRPPAWLGSGQTLNVNLVTNSAVQRLLVPATAVRRPGDRTVVLAVENGHAVEKIVVTRPPAGDKVPVLVGLTASDSIIVNPVNVRAGDAVRVRN